MTAFSKAFQLLKGQKGCYPVTRPGIETTGEYFELLKFAEAQEWAKQAMQYYEQRTILKA